MVLKKMTVSKSLPIWTCIHHHFPEILSVIWSQGKARAERWTEEVALLLEEMRRTLAYCEWKAAWWRAHKESRTGSAEVAKGASAYANKQAQMWMSLGASFATEWAPLIHKHSLPSDWPSQFSTLAMDNDAVSDAMGRKWLDRVDQALQVCHISTTRHARNNASLSDSCSD